MRHSTRYVPGETERIVEFAYCCENKLMTACNQINKTNGDDIYIQPTDLLHHRNATIFTLTRFALAPVYAIQVGDFKIIRHR